MLARLVWRLAHSARLGQTATMPMRPIAFPDPARPDGPLRAPDWISAGLARVTRGAR